MMLPTPYYDCDGEQMKRKPGPKKGYKQTKEHIEKRKRFGEQHHHWVGDEADTRTGRTRALRIFRKHPCEICGEGQKRIDRHHIDGNTLNNKEDNIVLLCRKCHMSTDGRIEKFIEMAKRNQPVAVAARWRKETVL
jgi:hypothetical protein